MERWSFAWFVEKGTLMSTTKSHYRRNLLVGWLVCLALLQPVSASAQSDDSRDNSGRMRRVAIVLYETAAVVGALSSTALIVAHASSSEARTTQLSSVGGAGLIIGAVLALVGSVMLLEVAPDGEQQGRQQGGEE